MIRHPKKNAWARSGFTLIELMVSITVLVTIMAVAWGSYSTVLSRQEQAQQETDRIHAVEQTMRRMIRELSMSFVTPHDEDAEGQMFEVRYRTVFQGERDEIHFTTLSHQRMFRDDKVGDQAEVSYRVASVTNLEGRSVRAIIRRMDAPIDEQPDEGGVEMVMLEDIKSFELEYWDDEKAASAAGSDAWVNDWDYTKTDYLNRLPSRIRVKLEIEHPNDPTRTLTFSTQAEIHLTKPIGR